MQLYTGINGIFNSILNGAQPISSVYCWIAERVKSLFFVFLTKQFGMHLQHTWPSANLYICVCWVTKSQGLMGFQAAAQAAGKIRFLGGLAAGRGLCALLHRPAARRGGERYQARTRQAGYTLPTPLLFLLSHSVLLSLAWQNCASAPLLCLPAHGSNLPVRHAKHLHVCVWTRVFLVEWNRRWKTIVSLRS